MKRTRLILIFCALAAVLLLVSCRTAPIYNINDAAIPQAAQGPMTMQQVQNAIVKAGTGLGWNMRVIKPGLIEATLNIRAHQAVVDITYDQQDYSINYKSSINLKYNGTKIHSNYNGWIQNLSQAINNNLAVIQ
ncbi:hypothetical protein LF599_06735 [Pseudodesulfovibrio thermohalotolerans]|uniref:hypothetical protein n=1 Tax=Pseudodesulfovibrio thermohalotolerans TaxID=2880651 RepID=UPI0022B9EB46|nr:hypothetical protein [Pseudodesulfovibrio thermohalotolerans]WFS63851.1 hypothetical protein LF599_06735 [Pseudodesulfovibrio thermohalotolerans]